MIYRSSVTYEQYTKMHDASANAILKRILISLGKNMQDIAQLFQISLNEAELYLTRKRLDDRDSAILSEYLKIGSKDYFIILQKNHDLYLERNELNQTNIPNLHKIRKSTFWDSNIELLDWGKGYKFIISRVYEYGNDMEKEEINRFYGRNIINEVLAENEKNKYCYHLKR